jgi:hypothetical protein
MSEWVGCLNMMLLVGEERGVRAPFVCPASVLHKTTTTLLPGSIEVSGPDFYCHRGQLVHCPWGEEPSYSLSLTDRKLTFGKCTTTYVRMMCGSQL